MDIAQAKDIMRTLADGRDPTTGKQFPPDCPYQQADTVRTVHGARGTNGGRAFRT